jgi:predicted transglutaminase-like cysteine proteinase
VIVPTYETTAREQEIIINNQRKEIERLNNNINKAINILEDNVLLDLEEYQKIEKVIDILKGVDKE